MSLINDYFFFWSGGGLFRPTALEEVSQRQGSEFFHIATGDQSTTWKRTGNNRTH